MRRFVGVALALGVCACGTVASDSDAPMGGDGPPTIDGPPGGSDGPTGGGDGPGTPDSQLYDASANDECAAGTDNCGANATCVDQPVGFMCSCNEGWSGDGVTCADVDECTAATDGCDPLARCDNTPGSYRCTCPTVLRDDSGGNGRVCSVAGDGHVVLIGHDFYQHTVEMDVMVGNAVALANTSAGVIHVAAYAQYADLGVGGEAANVDTGITNRLAASGRSAAITRFSDSTQLASALFGAQVLLVYEQEAITGNDSAYMAIADAWRSELRAFVQRGGVVVVAAGQDDHRLLQYTLLLEVTASTWTPGGTALSPVNGLDPVAEGVASYTGGNATIVYTSNEPNVVVRDPANSPIVIHRHVAPGHVVLMGHDIFARTPDVDILIGNAVALARTTGNIQILGYNQYADNVAGAEVQLTNDAIVARLAALGRTATITTFNDQTQLPLMLPGRHVLLVYEQEFSPDAVGTPGTVGAAWNARLQRFVRAGGVVIVQDCISSGGTWNLLAQAGLMAVAGGVRVAFGVGQNVVAPSNPLAVGLGATYPYSEGTVTFTTTDGTIVSTDAMGGMPVVVHKTFAPF